MLRKTTPAVSFTTSHMALMLRTSRPVFGKDMHSSHRYKAAWDEMPLGGLFMSRKDIWAWDWKCRFELGLGDAFRTTKVKMVMFYCLWPIGTACAYGYIWPSFYHAIFQEVIPHMNRDNGVEYSKEAYGRDVWCADGKFVQPWVHINPPMFTMTTEEL
jgi:hypothetical protein